MRSSPRVTDAVPSRQEELRKLESKETVLQAKIFELQCMRGKGLVAAEATGIVPRKELDPEGVPFSGVQPAAE